MLGKKKPKGQGKRSEIAIRYNLRVSSPYGYYPEDVDRVLQKLETENSRLEAETHALDAQVSKARNDLERMQQEFTKLKLEFSLLEVPDTSAAQDSAMLGRLESINPKVGSVPIETPKQKTPHLGDFDEVTDLNSMNFASETSPEQQIEFDASSSDAKPKPVIEEELEVLELD